MTAPFRYHVYLYEKVLLRLEKVHALMSFHIVGMMTSEQSKRQFNPQHQVVVSSRWNPTPEQLRTLEELYRRGTRTPSADQIQHITAQLRRYGKIEGKNVFYWFQNHKARERQKRRRQMESDDRQNINGSGPREIETLGSRETGERRLYRFLREHGLLHLLEISTYILLK